MAQPHGGVSRLVSMLLAVSALAGASSGISCRQGSRPPENRNAELPAAREVTEEAGSAVDGYAPARTILDAMKGLELSSDAKCHSTACRFENFLYGTPLNNGARDERASLQKELIHHIWSAASQVASEKHETIVSLQSVSPLIRQIVTTSKSENGDIQARFPGMDPVEISRVRFRQFSSIAYSLRAILSVQQDGVVNGSRLLPLDDESTGALRSLTDTVTLCALKLADQEARLQNSRHVKRMIMQEAWRRLIPSSVGAGPRVPVETAIANKKVRSQQSRQEFLALTENKLAAYQTYNELESIDLEQHFWRNVEAFYAIYPLGTKNKTLMAELSRAYGDQMRDFAKRLVSAADEIASTAGHLLIRAADANRAVSELMPHEIDDFEDVHLFFRLPSEDRVTLEAYDCDAYRDTGAHWQYLQDVYKSRSWGELVPDPFAAEIITEAISGYGVLLFRVAGKLAAVTSQRLPVLMPPHLTMARQHILDLTQQHLMAKFVPSTPAAIVSAQPFDPAPSTTTFFTPITTESGVDFVHGSTKWLSKFRRRKSLDQFPTFSGGGVAAEDINNDSHVDLLFVGGTGNGLYLNDGQGRFRDVTTQAGINFHRPDGSYGEARQAVITDFDNDGLQDILIAYNRDQHRLYRNLGGVEFEDVTAHTGLGGEGLISGPVTVFDFDNDGLLDVYLTCFGDYLQGAIPHEERNNTNALPNRLFRNLGGLRFADVTAGSGTDDRGWCQAVTHTDFDRDGLQDIIVANDFGCNALLRNLGAGRFENISPALQITKAYHSMNVGITDLNRDRYPDLYISNIATMVKDNKYVLPDVNTPLKFNAKAMANMLVKEANILYLSESNESGLVRYQPSIDVERGETSTGWAWDAEFFDFDNDGDDDLYVVNGTNDYNMFQDVLKVNQDGQQTFYHLHYQRESNVFFVNEGGKLKNQSGRSGADFKSNSRSVAYLDWDNDGDLDIAINNFHDPATLLQNNSQLRGNHWIKVRLVGDPDRGSNRDAIGAQIEATSGDSLYLLREVQGGSGYLSMEPKEQHIGLGKANSVDLRITWPNGQVQDVMNLPANHCYLVDQAEAGEEGFHAMGHKQGKLVRPGVWQRN